jgi:predicted small lipoprotein YifL
MKRALKLTALLIMTLSIAACGGGEPQQSDRLSPHQTAPRRRLLREEYRQTTKPQRASRGLRRRAKNRPA